MSCRRVTVFGGTGFLGHRIVRHLQDADFAVRIASRHPDRDRSLFSRDVSGIEPFRADVNDDGSVASAVSGAWAVVNAVSLYLEREQRTFEAQKVELPFRHLADPCLFLVHRQLQLSHDLAQVVQRRFGVAPPAQDHEVVGIGDKARVKEEADGLGLRTKCSTTANGSERGGKPFSRGHLYTLLSNPIYTGQIAHKGELHPGQQPALIVNQHRTGTPLEIRAIALILCQ
jgi:hypothetical protein